MADFEAGLFSISISDGDDSAPEAAEPPKSTTTAKVPGTARIAQSEDEFQAVKQGYRVKVENGEVSWALFIYSPAAFFAPSEWLVVVVQGLVLHNKKSPE